VLVLVLVLLFFLLVLYGAVDCGLNCLLYHFCLSLAPSTGPRNQLLRRGGFCMGLCWVCTAVLRCPSIVCLLLCRVGWRTCLALCHARIGDGDGGSEVGAVEMYTVLKSCIEELNVNCMQAAIRADGVTGMFGQGL
jgi:hypothetical protein